MRRWCVFEENALSVIEYVALEFRLLRVSFKIRAHDSNDVVDHDSRYFGIARIEEIKIVAQGMPKGMRAPTGGIYGDGPRLIGKCGEID